MEGILLSLCAALFLYLIRYLLHRAMAHLRDPSDKKRAVAAAEAVRSGMESRGYARLLSGDHVLRTRTSQEDLKSPERLREQMEKVMREILAHTGIGAGVGLRVGFDAKNDMRPDGRAGEYDPGSRSVTLFIKPKQRMEQLLYALCHECAHCFLYSIGMQESDPALNERYTEAAACLMGYSLYVIDGTRGTETPKEVSDKGSLTYAEACAVRRYLLSVRSSPAVRKEAPERQAPPPREEKGGANAELKSRLAGHIRGAQEILGQAKALAAAKMIPTRADMSEGDYQKLKEISRALESGEYDAALRRCGAALNGNDPGQLQSADSAAMDVCEKLSYILWAFR